MNPQQQARAELARRELARRSSASQQSQPENPGFLDTISNAADRITSTIPAVASLSSLPLGMAQYAGEKINEASGRLGGAVTEYAGEKGVPGVGAALLGTGAAIASNPMSYLNPEAGLNKSFKLPPAVGKPGYAARIKQMRTGVEAGSFERLRRDPTAFFNKTPRAEAGQAIGEAKQAAGINLGVTQDPASLTSGNIQRARSPMVASSKAQDAVIEKLEMSNLPVIKEGSKTGDPHAIYVYSDDFGPGGTKRAIYNVFGNPENKIVKERGWGSSVPKNELDKLGIPVTGRKAGSEKYLAIDPNEASQALEGINKRLSKLERSEGKGSPSFQQWSTIKSHFQNVLEDVAPEVKSANKDFSRVALRDKFMEPFPVNQAGTMSKISAFGGAPLAGGVGAVMGGGPGALAAAAMYQGARSPFIAGLGTAVRGLADKVIDPALSKATNIMSRRGALGNMINPSPISDELRHKAYASFIDKITTRDNP